MAESTALAVPGKRKLEAEIVLYAGNPEINRELEKVQTLQKSDFYTIGKGYQEKTVPSARALQWLANRKNIKTRIMGIESTKEYCRATVGAWIGNHPTPESNPYYKEATVEMIFEIELAEKVLELIYKENKYRMEKGKETLIEGKDWLIADNGLPMFTNENMQSKMMREMLRMRKFALRTVVTKAERIIHSKLADVEWRDEDELEDEIHEVELVADKKITPIAERAAELLPVKDNPEPIIDTDKPKPKAKDKPVETPEYLFNADTILDTPFATLESLRTQARDLGIGKLVKPIFETVVPEFFQTSMDLINLPEDKIIEIVRLLTGVRMEVD